jgi:hypothetical protein
VGDRGPARRRRSADGWPVWWGHGAAMAPLLQSDPREARLWFELDLGHCSSGPGPIH